MPYSIAFGDHFYCREDGRAECGHVFLAGNGLPGRWRAQGDFRIGELGFGTGLNFLETWRTWKARGAISSPSLSEAPQPSSGARHLHFVSFELHPMAGADIAKALSRWPEIAEERQALVAAWPEAPAGVVTLALAEDVILTVICGDALTNLAASDLVFDAWFLDGFAPSRNPDMWSRELMAAVFDHTRPGGTFATYAAAGFVRRNLIAARFDVERRPGFAGKREMLCGTRR